MVLNFIKFKLILLVVLANCTSVSQGQPSPSEVVNKLWGAIGGKENWQNARYFMFSCIGGGQGTFAQGERKYLWDKTSGNCRFEGTTTDDEAIVALFNIKEDTGSVYFNGEKLDNPRTAQDVIKEASTAFGKDAYLLFLPTALEGSQSSYTVTEEKLVGSQRFTVIHIKNQKTSFEATVDGRLYMDTQTGQVLEWKPSEGTLQFSISGFKDIGGGLVLPTQFTASNTRASVSYPIAAALVHIEGQKFNTP